MFDGPWETCLLVRGLNPSECATWVQAWGTVGAILATAWGVHCAHALQRRQKARDDFRSYTQFLECCFQMLGGARNVAFKIAQTEGAGAGSTPDERHTMLAELEQLGAAFTGIDLGRLDRYDYVEAMLVGGSLVRKLAFAVQYVDRPSFSPSLEGRYLAQQAEECYGTLAVRAKRLHDGIDRRGGNAVNDTAPF
jgi:hypothetical protein